MEHAGHDGPLLLALLLNNNNNNPANVQGPAQNQNPVILNLPGSNNPANAQGNNQTQQGSGPPDTLAIRPQDEMFELTKEGAANILGCRHQALSRNRGDLAGHFKSQAAAFGLSAQKSLARNISSIPNHGLDTVRNKIETSALTTEQLAFWDERGYLVLEDMLDHDQLAEMTADVNAIADRLLNDRVNIKTHPVVHGQRLGFEANGRVMVLLTENALNTSLEPLQRIQRLGTGVHRVLPNFRAATFTAINQQIALFLGISDPRVTQSMIITKAAVNGARVIPHQDGCSSFTNPPSCVTFWYALEDSTVENGCLKVWPGSHRTHPITKRCCRDDTGRPELRNLDVSIYMQSAAPISQAHPTQSERHEEFQSLEVKAGTLILMHGNLLHASEPNTSSRSRLAFNFGVVDGSLEWLPDNYLQPYDGEAEFERLAPLT